MTNELKNVPELRFSEFDGVWENSKLGTVANVYDGTHQTPKYTIEGIKFLSVENIKTLNSNKFISKEAFEKEFKIRPEFGDVLMTRIGDVGTPNVIETNEDLAYYVSLALLKPKKLNSYFLESLIRSQTVQNELWRKTLHIAFPKKINKNEIAKVEINYPEQMEQQKIGEFFSKLDRQIELEEQKLEKLEEQKKGYMQKIFSKELRFKDENGNNYPEWEEKKLKELIDVRDGTHESPKPSKEGYLLVTSKNLKNSKLDLSESYFISKEDYESINQRSKVEIGDILFGMIGTIGNPILLEECDFAIKNVALLKTHDLLEKYYILNFLKSSNISKQFYRMNAGGTQKFIALSTIRDLNIDMPSSEEAIKIGNFFNKVDNLIENQSNKLELLKERKKGFLQKMFI
ncbi:restriction endonuclease subunit S [Staphylococcus pseudintermedius]|nr:restriction endonuclease subunit S [Staphylococcus pseudintermedius]